MGTYVNHRWRQGIKFLYPTENYGIYLIIHDVILLKTVKMGRV